LISVFYWYCNVLRENWDWKTSENVIVYLAARKSRTLELLAFDEYCRFDSSAFVIHKASCMKKIYVNLREPAPNRRARAMHWFSAGHRYSTATTYSGSTHGSTSSRAWL
jgi:hypothetical protein